MAQIARLFELTSYTESDFAEMMGDMISDGVFWNLDNKLAVSAPGGMVVNIATGRAFVQGFWYKNDAVVGLAIAANGAGSTRIDRVVLKLDRAANTLVLAIHQGVAGAGAPALTRAVGGAWELSLAQVSVGPGVSGIVAGNLTDERSIPGTCGWAGISSPFGTPGDLSIPNFAGFQLDNDTGLYNVASNIIQFIVGHAAVAEFQAAGIKLGSPGYAAAPVDIGQAGQNVTFAGQTVHNGQIVGNSTAVFNGLVTFTGGTSGIVSVPSGAVVFFELLAELTAAGAGWARYTAGDGRLLVGAGTTFTQTFAQSTNYGANWTPAVSVGAATATTATANAGGFLVPTAGGTTNTMPDHTHNFTPTLTGLTTAWVPPMRAGIWGRKT